jgi:hypothetical protein
MSYGKMRVFDKLKTNPLVVLGVAGSNPVFHPCVSYGSKRKPQENKPPQSVLKTNLLIYQNMIPVARRVQNSYAVFQCKEYTHKFLNFQAIMIIFCEATHKMNAQSHALFAIIACNYLLFIAHYKARLRNNSSFR